MRIEANKIAVQRFGLVLQRLDANKRATGSEMSERDVELLLKTISGRSKLRVADMKRKVINEHERPLLSSRSIWMHSLSDRLRRTEAKLESVDATMLEMRDMLIKMSKGEAGTSASSDVPRRRPHFEDPTASGGAGAGRSAGGDATASPTTQTPERRPLERSMTASNFSPSFLKAFAPGCCRHDAPPVVVPPLGGDGSSHGGGAKGVLASAGAVPKVEENLTERAEREASNSKCAKERPARPRCRAKLNKRGKSAAAVATAIAKAAPPVQLQSSAPTSNETETASVATSIASNDMDTLEA